MMELNAHTTEKPCEQLPHSNNFNASTKEKSNTHKSNDFYTSCILASSDNNASLSTTLPRHQGERVLLHACCGPCSMEPIRLLKERGFAPAIYFANSNIHPACEYVRRLDTLREFATLEGIPVIEGPYNPDAWEKTVGRLGDHFRQQYGVIADEHAAEFARQKDAERSHEVSQMNTERNHEALQIEDKAAAHDLHNSHDSRHKHHNRNAGSSNTWAPHETNPLDYIPSVGNTTTQAQAARATRCRACYRIRFQETAQYAATHGYPLLGTTLSVSPYQHTAIIQEELERATTHVGIQSLFEDYRPYYDNATRRSKDAGMYRQNYCGCRFSDEEASAERAARKAERKLVRVAEKLLAAKNQVATLTINYIDPAYPKEAFEVDSLPYADTLCFHAGKNDEPHIGTFKAFDTTVEIIAYGSTDAAEQTINQAHAMCCAYERRLSAWLPHSDIARLNNSKGKPCPIHADTAALLSASLDYCKKSSGVFDITMGPVIRLWDFHRGIVPQAEDIRKALEHVDWRKVHLFQHDNQWFGYLADPCMQINLGGIAKGWIADQLARTLLIDTNDLVALSINLGGNVVVRGTKPSGDPWHIGIRNPLQQHNNDSPLDVLSIQNASLVTSGTYERCFTTPEGTTYHHILSTSDGYPVKTDLVSATVMATHALDAEGYSTTLLALGLKDAQEFVQSEPAIITAFLVEADGTMHQV